MTSALETAWQLRLGATLWHTPNLDPKHPCKGYADANPNEAAALDAWVFSLAAGGTPADPAVATATGHWLVAVVKACLAGVTPPPPPPPPPGAMPAQGVSAPLGNVTGKSDADQNWFLDRLVELGNGHQVFLRIDWWPGQGLRRLLTLNRHRFKAHRLGANFGSLATKIAARPSITILPLLSYPNGSKPTPSTFASYATQLAQHGFQWINILNEPDMNGWDPKEAAAYFKAARDAIRAVNPSKPALAIGPSTWKTGSQKPADGVAWDKAFIEELHRLGSRVDIFDKHLYNFVSGDRSWNNWAYLGDIRAILDANGMADVGIMATEMGDKPDAVGDQRQVDAVATGFDARSPGYVAPSDGYHLPVAPLSTLVYSLFNDAEPGGFGLYRTDRSARPAVATFRARAR